MGSGVTELLAFGMEPPIVDEDELIVIVFPLKGMDIEVNWLPIESIFCDLDNQCVELYVESLCKRNTKFHII